MIAVPFTGATLFCCRARAPRAAARYTALVVRDVHRWVCTTLHLRVPAPWFDLADSFKC